MRRKVAIVDYDSGNILSVARALAACGADPVLIQTAADIRAADRVVLPGVGAFADGMRNLGQRGLLEALLEFGNSGKPMLGICLGMQMLLSRSYEFGDHQGLDLIPGEVVAIPSTGEDGRRHKIPHIGWASLEVSPGADWRYSILDPVRPGASVYLVHSFTARPKNPTHRLADCHYNGRLISAAIRSGNVFGCQFHPEKSGAVGLSILTEFVSR
jgi:imidazole glycerol-phosphate synthase subunit HisH